MRALIALLSLATSVELLPLAASDAGGARAPGSIGGVASFADGRPAAGIGVWLGGEPFVTASDGSWTGSAPAPGVYGVTFFYDGRVVSRQRVAVAPGAPTQLLTRLAPSIRATAGRPMQNAGLAGTASYDRGLSIYHCPDQSGLVRKPRGRRSSVRAVAAGTSEAGWPPDQCLKMDKGPWLRKHTLVGINGVHNWLLGGYGTDTIVGGESGDVIWSDYRPTGGPPFQVSVIHAGNGRNVIYANATRDYVWTGTNPRTVVHSHDDYAGGVIHCQNPAIVVYLSVISQRHYKLDGCHHISHYSVGY